MTKYSERVESVTNQLDALVSYANETTGASDTRIGDAIDTLVAGYGSGGGGVQFNRVVMNKYTVTLTADQALAGYGDMALFGAMLGEAVGTDINHIFAFEIDPNTAPATKKPVFGYGLCNKYATTFLTNKSAYCSRYSNDAGTIYAGTLNWNSSTDARPAEGDIYYVYTLTDE